MTPEVLAEIQGGLIRLRKRAGELPTQESQMLYELLDLIEARLRQLDQDDIAATPEVD